jgi:hypothetical protein
MDLVAELATWIWTALGFVLNRLGEWFVVPLLNDASFQAGFAWGVSIALLLGWFSRQVLFLRAQVLRYFNPTQVPATTPGPSPSQIASGCRWAVLRLAVLIGFGLLVLFIVVQAFRAVK